jgi:hypothetical protein
VQAILALLCGKLLGQRRISHISDLCNDEGAGLFAGLNVLPKATFATDYSYRTERPMSDRFVKTLLYTTDAGGAVAAVVRGDHEVSEAKLIQALGAQSVAMAGQRIAGILARGMQPRISAQCVGAPRRAR